MDPVGNAASFCTVNVFIQQHDERTSGIHAGGSIGMHRHETSDDINYIISGNGEAICDGKEEKLTAGTCHICRKGSEHSIFNTGAEDLVMLTVVVER